jgi:hypothetical protein
MPAEGEITSVAVLMADGAASEPQACLDFRLTKEEVEEIERALPEPVPLM